MNRVQEEGEPRVIMTGLVDMQICVPKPTSDEEVVKLANRINPCGTRGGWQIRRRGSVFLSGGEERQQCEEHESHVHIMLDC
jgi:hypothetical protein